MGGLLAHNRKMRPLPGILVTDAGPRVRSLSAPCMMNFSHLYFNKLWATVPSEVADLEHRP